MSDNFAYHAIRYPGRLFIKDGALHMVLDVSADRGMARVSSRGDGPAQITEMPILEVVDLITSGGPLKLDGLSAERTEKRVLELDGKWYFSAREGRMGPYADKDAANEALRKHILHSQENGISGRDEDDQPKVAAL